jgi:hypothetical protein
LISNTPSTEVLITGCSAGGLTTILHANEIKELMPVTVTKFKILPLSGLFIDIPNAEGDNIWYEQMITGFKFHKGAQHLDKDCVSMFIQHGENAILNNCLFPQQAIEYVTQTPMLIVNSQVDSFTVQCIFGETALPLHSPDNINCTSVFKGSWSPCLLNASLCSITQVKVIDLSIGIPFRKTVSNSKVLQKDGNGIYSFSCYQHCGETTTSGWSKTKVKGMTIRDVVKDWWLSNNQSASYYTYHDCSYINDVCCNPTCC